MTVKNCHLFVSFVYKLSPLQYFSSLRYFFHLRNRSSQQPSPQFTSNLCKKPSADLRSDPEIADTTIDCLGLGISSEVDPTVRICAGCAERVDAQHAFRTRDLHCNSYVENGLEDKEDEDVCRFCLMADGGAAFVELFPGGGGSIADEVQTMRDCLGVEINSWDMVTKICGECVGGVKELATFRTEFSPTAGTVKLEDVMDSSDSYRIEVLLVAALNQHYLSF
ncbi:uncharacterized protein LOC128093788 [Culex pipiens pallens]|uniref:uncharacterized protein LOC128093788 n=1 Tax=Culex pipiens pallens TaxID=42434 RepID=UPI0022AAD446|nr:uncharacterized protein LOC128093788 [Culex pipiens pallens]